VGRRLAVDGTVGGGDGPSGRADRGPAPVMGMASFHHAVKAADQSER